MLRRSLVAATATAVGMLIGAPQAVAQDGAPPCELALAFVCSVLPMAPDLDHNVDLTQNQPPAGPPPESLPVLNPCAAGCI